MARLLLALLLVSSPQAAAARAVGAPPVTPPGTAPVPPAAEPGEAEPLQSPGPAASPAGPTPGPAAAEPDAAETPHGTSPALPGGTAPAPAGEPAPAAEETAPVPPGSEGEPPGADRSPAPSSEKELFTDAVEAMKEQRWGTADRLLLRYLEQYPSGRYSLAARALQPVSRHLALTFEAGGEEAGKRDRSGRTELVITSTAYGVWAGMVLSALLGVNDSSLLVSALTAGIGLGGSLALTREGEITEGQAALVGSGAVWGTWNGIGLAVLVGADSPEAWFGDALLLGTAGFIGGLTASRQLHPDAGDISVVNSGGIWGGFGAGMLALLLGPHLEGDDAFLVIIAGSDVGLATMAFLIPQLDLSRSRSRMIDLGGFLGVLVTGGVLMLTAGGSLDEQAVGGTLLGGAILGLAIGTSATKDWDREERGGGEGVTLLAPSPFVLGPRGGTHDRALGLHLLQGRF